MEKLRTPWLLIPILASLLILGLTIQSRLSGVSSRNSQVDIGATNCDFILKQSGWCGHLQWTRPPELPDDPNQPNSAKLTFTALNSLTPPQPLPTEVLVSLWMPGMGHGSAPIETHRIQESEPPTWMIQNVFFSMAGEWEIWLTLMNGSQFIEKASHQVYISEPGRM